MKRLVALCGSLVFVMGCSNNTMINANTSIVVPDQESVVYSENNQESATEVAVSTLDTENMFSNRDSRVEYDEEETTYIELNNETITILEAGTYVLSGSIENGQIIISAGKDVDKIQLVLDNVDISCSYSAPIYVSAADKVFVTLAEGSLNTLTVTDEYKNFEQDNVDGAIFSRADITFNGTGQLNINDAFGNGIVGKDDVVFTGGLYYINAAGCGIDANDSVRIKDGRINIESEKDGIHVEDSDPEKGYLYVENGLIAIQSAQDCISTSGTLQIDGGSYVLISGGGYQRVLNSITVGEGKGNTVHATETLENSMKAIKGNEIIINDGDFSISSYEDAIHSNDNLTINGGKMYILSGDDGIHADNLLTINGGNISIENAYEGLEGSSITINGGEIFASVLDDAINASSSDGILTITGGDIHIEAQGDGVDSNGAFTMTGGNLLLDVNAIYAGGDGNIDVDGLVTYTGGTIVDINGNAIDPTASLGGRNGGGGMKGMPMTPDMQMQNMGNMKNQMQGRR